MRSNEARTAIAKEFFDRVRAAGHGTVSRLQRKMQVGKNFFATKKDFSSIRLNRLLQALDFLEINPKEFFSSALSPRPSLLAKRSRLGRIARSRIGDLAEFNDGDKREGSREEVAEFDRMRDDSPQKALRSIGTKILESRLALLPWLLGSAASAYRVQAKPGEALDCLMISLDIARQLQCHAAIADSLVRRSYVYGDHGELRLALNDVDEALLNVSLAGHESLEVGLVLQERSKLLYYMGRHEESISTAQAALPLTESDAANYAAMQHGLALLLTEKGDYKNALEHLQKGFERAPETISNRAGFLWLEARIHRERGMVDEACRCFESTISLYLESSSEYMLGQAALVGIEMVDSLHKADRALDASRAAKSLVKLSIRAEMNPIVGSAILALVQAASNLDNNIITEAKRRVRDGITSHLRCSAVRL